MPPGGRDAKKLCSSTFHRSRNPDRQALAHSDRGALHRFPVAIQRAVERGWARTDRACRGRPVAGRRCTLGWNGSDQLRAILIFDIWNPYLNQAERELVCELLAGFTDYYKQD